MNMILIKQFLKNKILLNIFLLLCIGCTNEQDIVKYKITNIVNKLQTLNVPQCKKNRFTDIASNFYLMAINECGDIYKYREGQIILQSPSPKAYRFFTDSDLSYQYQDSSGTAHYVAPTTIGARHGPSDILYKKGSNNIRRLYSSCVLYEDGDFFVLEKEIAKYKNVSDAVCNNMAYIIKSNKVYHCSQEMCEIIAINHLSDKLYSNGEYVCSFDENNIYCNEGLEDFGQRAWSQHVKNRKKIVSIGRSRNYLCFLEDDEIFCMGKVSENDPKDRSIGIESDVPLKLPIVQKIRKFVISAYVDTTTLYILLQDGRIIEYPAKVEPFNSGQGE